MSLRCHVCGFENVYGSKNCSECGVSIEEHNPFRAGEGSSMDTQEVVEKAEPVDSLSTSPEPDEVSKSAGHDSNGGEIVPVPDNSPAQLAYSSESSDSSADGEEPFEEASLKVESAGDLTIQSCPSCAADVDESDFYCSICGINLKNYVASEDILKAATNSLPVTEPGGKAIFRLSVVTGHDQGAVHSISRPEALLGRALDNDIVLASDGYTSGRHSRVFKEDDVYYVEDLGSTNGTFVRVKGKVAIKSGDEIKIGQSIFRLEDGEL